MSFANKHKAITKNKTLRGIQNINGMNSTNNDLMISKTLNTISRIIDDDSKYFILLFFSLNKYRSNSK